MKPVHNEFIQTNCWCAKSEKLVVMILPFLAKQRGKKGGVLLPDGSPLFWNHRLWLYRSWLKDWKKRDKNLSRRSTQGPSAVVDFLFFFFLIRAVRTESLRSWLKLVVRCGKQLFSLELTVQLGWRRWWMFRHCRTSRSFIIHRVSGAQHIEMSRHSLLVILLRCSVNLPLSPTYLVRRYLVYLLPSRALQIMMYLSLINVMLFTFFFDVIKKYRIYIERISNL